MKKEYVQAAIDRINNWCKATGCEIPNITYVAIQKELKTMFKCSTDINKKGIYNNGKN